MSEELQTALPVVVPAALIAAAVMLVAWWPLRRSDRRSQPLANAWWAGACAVGVSFIAGLWQIADDWPGLPPKQRWMWLMPMAIAATVLGMVSGWLQPRHVVQLAVGLLLALSATLLLHPPPAVDQPWLWKLGLGAAVLIVWLCLEVQAERHPGPSLPLAMTIVFTGVSLVIKESRFAMLSLSAAAASAAWGSVLLISIFNSKLRVSRGPMHVAAMLLPAMLVLGEFDRRGGVSIASFLLLAIAPLMLWLGELPPLRTRRPWQAALARAALVAVPVLIAVVLAMRAGQDDGYLYY